MKKVPKISETEWEIMRILWAKAPLPFSEIFQALAAAEASWHPKTAQTLLNRLVKKGALGFKKEKRGHWYFPRVKESDCVDAASESFLQRVFRGSLTPMLAHFVERGKLSKAEARELKRILEEGK